MLNLFPIQFLAPLAYLLLRICVGAILIRLAGAHLRNRKGLAPLFSFRFFPYGTFFVWYLSVIELVLGILFIVGFITQIAALLTMLLSLKFLVMQKRFVHSSIPEPLFYTLLFFVSLSLFITGAGALAIDLPI